MELLSSLLYILLCKHNFLEYGLAIPLHPKIQDFIVQKLAFGVFSIG